MRLPCQNYLENFSVKKIFVSLHQQKHQMKHYSNNNQAWWWQKEISVCP